MVEHKIALVEFLIIAAGFLIIYLGSIRRSDLYYLGGTAIVLTYANNNAVNNLTYDLLGFGGAWVIILIVALLNIIHFSIHPRRYLFVSLSKVDLAMLAALFYMGCISLVMAPERASALGKVVSYVVIFAVGAKVLGSAFQKQGLRLREYLYKSVYFVGAVNIAFILVVFLLIRDELLNPQFANLTIGGRGLSRFQAGGMANAVGLGVAAATSLFLTYHWYAISNKRYVRLMLAMLALGLVAVLVVTGSRGAMIGWLITTFVILLCNAVYYKRGRLSLALATVVVIAGGISYSEQVVGLLMRTSTAASIADVAYESRYEVAVETYRYAGVSGVMLGMGPGASFSIPEQLRLRSHIESFWLQLLLEWGLVGSLLYLYVLARMTYHVFLMDLRAMRRGERGAWLISSIFLFTWVTSPFYFGYAVFTGAIAVTFGIGVAAMHWNYYCDQMMSKQLVTA